MIKGNFVSQLVQSEENCQTIPEWSQFSQGHPRKRQKTMSHWPEHFHENLVPLPTYLSFLKTFPTKMKPTKCPAREKKWGKKSQKGGEERKRKVKVKTAVSLFNPKLVSKFYFLRMPERRKLMVCIWIKRLRSVQPVKSFVVSFSSLQHNSDQKTSRLNMFFSNIFRREWVKLHVSFSIYRSLAISLKTCFFQYFSYLVGCKERGVLTPKTP